MGVPVIEQVWQRTIARDLFAAARLRNPDPTDGGRELLVELLSACEALRLAGTFGADVEDLKLWGVVVPHVFRTDGTVGLYVDDGDGHVASTTWHASVAPSVWTSRAGWTWYPRLLP